MTDRSLTDRKMTLCRLAMWLAALLVSLTFYRTDYPTAWQAAAFGALFALLWPWARRINAGSAPSLLVDEESAPKPTLAVPLLDVGMDLLVVTTLIHYSGGFSSVFAPLYFVVVIEAYALLGAAESVYAALACAALSLINLNHPVDRNSAILYGVAIGTILISAVLVGVHQGLTVFAAPGAAAPLFGWRPRSSILRERTVETLEQELEEQLQAHRRLKSTYREVAGLHRDQRQQIERLRVGELLLVASGGGDAQGASAYARLLRVLMDAMEAGGAVLWLPDRGGDSFTAQSTEGRVAPSLPGTSVTETGKMPPSQLREQLEDVLRAASPYQGTAPAARSEEMSAPCPTMVILLRDAPADHAAANPVIGAVGICDPRGVARFTQTDQESFEQLAAPFAAALGFVLRRRDLQRRLREMELLYEMSNMAQTTTDPRRIYSAIIDQVNEVVSCENCTLFLFDKERQVLEAKATSGRVVNLLDHISFERGQGVSAWVAGHGKPLTIGDLTKERNLLDVEMIPPRVRSFMAIPLKIADLIVGVLNLSDSRPDAFGQEDLQILTLLAGQAAVTIDRSDAFHTLETLAITDGLTQVFNHRYFDIRLDDEVKRARRYNLPLSLMLVDVDHFKQINDLYGHGVGDSILRQLAQLMRASVRDTEIVARYGGDEFGFILPQTAADQATVAAERMRVIVRDHQFEAEEGVSMRLTISIGIAGLAPNTQLPKRIVEQADIALYAAKQAGRDCVKLAGSALAGA